MRFSLEGIVRAVRTFGWSPEFAESLRRPSPKHPIQKNMESQGWIFITNENIMARAEIGTAFGIYDDQPTQSMPISDDELRTAYLACNPHQEILVTDAYDATGNMHPEMRAVYTRPSRE